MKRDEALTAADLAWRRHRARAVRMVVLTSETIPMLPEPASQVGGDEKPCDRPGGSE